MIAATGARFGGRSIWEWLALLALWSVPIAAALVLDSPLGATNARELAGGLLGPAVAGYLGYCPLPLVGYFFAALAMRHPLALLLAARARAAVGPVRAPATVNRALTAAYVAWALLGGGGALIVAAAVGAQGTAFRWALEIAQLTVLAGLPCLSLSLTCGLGLKRTAVFWSIAPLTLFVCGTFALGLHGERIAPVLPGVIEIGLTSGRDVLRTRATAAALAWPLLGWLAVFAICFRNRQARKSRPGRGNDSVPPIQNQRTLMKAVAIGSCILTLAVIGCGGEGDRGADTNGTAVNTPSGFEASRPLPSLSEQERTQYCVAVSMTLYSATTPARECELEGVVNAQLMSERYTCEDVTDMCLMSFVELAELKCVEQIEGASSCVATVGDGEACSLATAELRASLLPNVTCATAANEAQAAIPKIYAASRWAATPECQRYMTCRTTL